MTIDQYKEHIKGNYFLFEAYLILIKKGYSEQQAVNKLYSKLKEDVCTI
jgi:hypothetical protein